VLMLQAYIDESAQMPKGVFGVAGYLWEENWR